MSSRPSVWQRLKHVVIPRKQKDSRIIARADHPISRRDISANALGVLYRLHKANYQAYLVGGSVRDLLVGRHPKDFDIVTNAEPEQIRQLFSNSRLIGRRFKLVHVFFRNEIIEVSTFRGASVTHGGPESNPALVRDDNRYGTLQEDVWRRDFTVNALYYNIADFSIVDYTEGMQDIKRRLIRMIGEPSQRFQEDPVRMLRAVRLAAKLEFSIHADIEKLFSSQLELLHHVSPSRLFDEVLKLFFAGSALPTYLMLRNYGFVETLFPALEPALSGPEGDYNQRLVEAAMLATDERYEKQMSLNPGFLFAVMLWPVLQLQIHAHPDKKMKLFQVLHHAVAHVLHEQGESLNIPRRLLAMIRDIWMLQYHLKSRRGKRVYRTIHHRYYRAAIDFLQLRAKVGEPVQELVQWWQKFQAADADEQQRMCKSLSRGK